MKRKTAKETFDAYQSLELPVCKNLFVDEGKEFYNQYFTRWCNANGVNRYSTKSDTKNPFVERLNRTLMGLIWKMWLKNNNRIWFDKLDDIATQYNNKKRRSLKGQTTNQTYNSNSLPAIVKKPKQVEITNEDVIRMYLNKPLKIPKVKQKVHKPNYKEGDIVRISAVKGHFSKGYTNNWSIEKFEVVEQLDGFPFSYRLKDMAGEVLDGQFYEKELQHTTRDENVLLGEAKEEWIDEDGVKWYLMPLLGHPAKFDRWIKEEDLLEQ